jgi:hypothetical protein
MKDITAFGDWSTATASNMREWSEDTLFRVMDLGGGSIYDSRARAELTRRQNEKVGVLLQELSEATNKVHREVALLAASSEKMERLTANLQKLTIYMMVFAGIQIAVATVQTWKAFFPTPPTQSVSPQPPLDL